MTMTSILHTNPQHVSDLNREFDEASLERILQWSWETFGTKAAIGTSFQGAGLVMIHHALQAGLPFPVFTIDTGLLFPETLTLKLELEDFFGLEIESLHPEQTVDQQAAEMGPSLWESNPDTCCILRKVMPLQKKLATLDAWITGLRRQQSETRQQTKIVEVYKFDVLRDRYIVKLNPMAPWSRAAVWEYIHKHQIPYNALHDRGYRSIGCVPCTRVSGDGDQERAGRWTGFDKSECGIHTFLGDNI